MPTDTTAPTKRPRKGRGESANSQTIDLRSGGSIRLSGDFNLFSMSPDDVAFVSELGAAMRKYAEMGATKGLIRPTQAAQQVGSLAQAPGPKPS